ncbi:hypothetical protein CB1_002145001 [Camelus ferus]|nr:hypothetical protein CB1_002145001 [Camelus ferus]
MRPLRSWEDLLLEQPPELTRSFRLSASKLLSEGTNSNQHLSASSSRDVGASTSEHNDRLCPSSEESCHGWAARSTGVKAVNAVSLCFFTDILQLNNVYQSCCFNSFKKGGGVTQDFGKMYQPPGFESVRHPKSCQGKGEACTSVVEYDVLAVGDGGVNRYVIPLACKATEKEKELIKLAIPAFLAQIGFPDTSGFKVTLSLIICQHVFLFLAPSTTLLPHFTLILADEGLSPKAASPGDYVSFSRLPSHALTLYASLAVETDVQRFRKKSKELVEEIISDAWGPAEDGLVALQWVSHDAYLDIMSTDQDDLKRGDAAGALGEEAGETVHARGEEQQESLGDWLPVGGEEPQRSWSGPGDKIVSLLFSYVEEFEPRGEGARVAMSWSKDPERAQVPKGLESDTHLLPRTGNA